jgi:hypothetical protein
MLVAGLLMFLASTNAVHALESASQIREHERPGVVRYSTAEEPAGAPPGLIAAAAKGTLSLPDFAAWTPARSHQARAGGVPLWLAPIFSALIPGSGQLHLGQDRFAGYAAVEAYGWIRYLTHRADGKRARNGYRSLAADVARSAFSSSTPVGDFEYYEQMRRYLESGVFDVSDAPGVQPELDESTYNGTIWRRARDTFWDDPNVEPPTASDAYMRSIDFYSRRAVSQEFRWSWRNAQLEHDLFGRTIEGSNDDFRRSVTDFGVILGNHVLSMVDAFVALRLRAGAPAAGSGYSISARIAVRNPTP